MDNKNTHGRYQAMFFSLILSFLITINADAHDSNAVTDKVQKTKQPVITSILSSPVRISDTLGPSFTLTQGSAGNRTIAGIDTTHAGYYSSADCSGSALGAISSITGSGFTFIDNQSVFFGQTALSALSAANTSTQCIYVVLNQSTSFGTAAYLGLKIQNLSCNGTTCTGGNICYTSLNSGTWGTSSTSACSGSLPMLPYSLPTATVGDAYSATVSASGGIAPYTYTVTTGALPAGLSLDSSTGIISGTPTINGTSNFTITATDSGLSTGSVPYSINVISPQCATAGENATANINCPASTVVTSITFASYGTPSGTCGNFALGACNAATSVSVVTTACSGQSSCSVDATNDNFGDPCGGTVKELYIQVQCG